MINNTWAAGFERIANAYLLAGRLLKTNFIHLF